MPPLSTTINKPSLSSRAWKSPDQSLTRPANATAYAAHAALGSASSSLFKFTGFFGKANMGAKLTGMRLVAAVAGIAITDMGAVRAHLFNAAPAADVADAAAFAMKFADVGKSLGYVDFAADKWQTGGAGSDMIENYGVPVVENLPLFAAGNSQDLYVVLEAVSGFTPKASTVIAPFPSAQFGG